jgi:hypothetical protein
VTRASGRAAGAGQERGGPSLERYVVAVRRELRSRGISAECVGEIPGVCIRGAHDPQRVEVEATEAAISEVAKRFGDTLVVERTVTHRRL